MRLTDDMMQTGFRLEDRVIYPSRNLVVAGAEEQHVEPKAMQVLLVLASNEGQVVSRETLLDEVWPGTYSGDAALTRCISLLRACLGERGGQTQFIETVSKSGYRLAVPVEELHSKEPPAGEAEQSGPSRFPMMPAAGLGLVVATGILVFALRAPNTTTAGPGTTAAAASDVHSIAVLPFSNLSGDADNEYLSDGVSEEILNVLSRIPDLRVTSRSSSFSFKNAGLPLSEIAQRLHVDSLLEGSVRKFDERIRISVQLIDARSDVLLWSESYDRLFDDVLLIQDQIARAVADTLKLRLEIDDAAKGGQNLKLASVEAHEAFLRGRYLSAQRTRASLENAVVEYERALAIQPDHAAALSELAITHLLLRSSQYGNLLDIEAFGRAEPLIARAVEINPGLAEVQAASGFLAWLKGESQRAEQHFRRALEVNPNYAIVYHWMSMMQFRALGQFQASFESRRMARLLDPVSVPITNIYIQTLLLRNMLDDAAAEIEQLKSISPTAHYWLKGELEALGGNWSRLFIGHLEGLLIDPRLSRARSFLPNGLVRLNLLEEAAAFRSRETPTFLMDQGKADEAVALAREQSQSDPESVWFTRTLSRALFYAGRNEETRELLEVLWLRLDKRAAVIGRYFFTLIEATELFVLRKAAGDDAGAAEVLAVLDAENQRARAAGLTVTRLAMSLDFAEGMSLFLAGRENEGLERILAAVQDGFVIKRSWPYFKILSENPGFARVLEAQDRIRDRELQKLLNIVCRDNPYREVWQPRAETCALLDA